jgi:preprotein translocase subunit SecF
MAFPVRYFPENTRIDFMKLRIPAISMSLLVIAAMFVLLFTKGLNLGIDFTGGILIELRTQETADLAKMREALPTKEFGEVALQYFGDDHEILVRLPAREDTNQAKVVEHVKATLNKDFKGIEYRKVDFVGPTVGKELVEAAILSLLLSFAAMMLYIWFRFEWQYGVGGIFALLHDAAMIILFYLVSGFEFSLTSIAAVLTIIGYSINDSVVIYDRIRENMRRYKQMPIAELINVSVNETLSRTVLTAGTTILSAIALVVFGGEVLRGFSMALLFGLVVGTYSSIYISAPILIYFNLRSNETESKVKSDAALAAAKRS